MHGQLVAVLDGADDFADVGEVDARIDALRVKIEAERHEAHVAGALAVAEEAAFDPVGAGHHAELRRSDTAAAIVVRMEGEHDAVAAREVAVHPLDLVGVDVGRRHLDRRGKIDDRLALRAWAATRRARRRRPPSRNRAPCR